MPHAHSFDLQPLFEYMNAHCCLKGKRDCCASNIESEVHHLNVNYRLRYLERDGAFVVKSPTGLHDRLLNYSYVPLIEPQ